MTPIELKHYLVRGASTHGLANALANGAICWWLVKDKGVVTWWGSSNFGGDLLVTGFVLPLIVALIVIPLHKNKVRTRTLPTIAVDIVPTWMTWFLGLPENLWLRALLFGIVGVVVFALPTLGLLALYHVNTLTPLHYSVFKGVWAGTLAFVLVMPMTTLALTTTRIESEISHH